MSLVFGLSPFSVVATIVVIALVWWVIARSRRRTTPERKSRLNDEVVLSRFRVLLGGVEARLEISRDSLWWSAPNGRYLDQRRCLVCVCVCIEMVWCD